MGTFNPLFPNGYYVTLSGYTGDTNLLHFKPSITITPQHALKLLAAVGLLWRETTADAIYLQPDIPIQGTAGRGGSWTAVYGQLRADCVFSAHLTGPWRSTTTRSARPFGGRGDTIAITSALNSSSNGEAPIPEGRTNMKFSSIPAMPVLLSVTAGYVDTAGYLALQGLFTAHVTGNFVTLGASLVTGTSGALAKLLALPTFCAVIIATRWVSYLLPPRGLPILRTMLSLKVVLLGVAAVLAIRYGPFSNGDSGAALATGLTLVSAMAIQNAAQRIHLGASPPTTLMTGTTTQIMIDVADFMRGMPAEKKDAARPRLQRMTAAVVAFASGCTAAAIMYARAGVYCFLVPPLLGVGTLMFRMAAFEGDVR